MKVEQKKKVFQLMREILVRAGEKVQLGFQPNAGERENWEHALRVLRNSGVIDFEWNFKDKTGNPVIGAVMVILTAGNLLQVFNDE